MWKLLSGIAVILVLDIVFIWMMALEPDAPEIARAIGPTAAVPVIHDEPSGEPEAVDDRLEPSDESGNIRASRQRNYRKAHPSGRVRRFDSGTETVSAAAPSKLFQDTIIWIGRTEVPVKIERDPFVVRSEMETTQDVQADVSDTERPEVKKRSFQSKAIGVIKKPYDLIKAFADKFN